MAVTLLGGPRVSLHQAVSILIRVTDGDSYEKFPYIQDFPNRHRRHV